MSQEEFWASPLGESPPVASKAVKRIIPSPLFMRNDYLAAPPTPTTPARVHSPQPLGYLNETKSEKHWAQPITARLTWPPPGGRRQDTAGPATSCCMYSRPAPAQTLLRIGGTAHTYEGFVYPTAFFSPGTPSSLPIIMSPPHCKDRPSTVPHTPVHSSGYVTLVKEMPFLRLVLATVEKRGSPFFLSQSCKGCCGHLSDPRENEANVQIYIYIEFPQKPASP